MLTIAPELQAKIVAHARADHPDEACGVIAGPAGSDRPERFIPMVNAERSPTFYQFDSIELLRLWREMDERDEEPVVIYHSHTATEAYPSRTDIAYASEPGAHYVLVSTREPDEAEFRSFRIVDGVVTEEEVRIVADAAGRPPVDRNDPLGRPVGATREPPPPASAREADTQERRSWPSRSASRPSCAPTPAARRPSRAPAPRSPSSSTTSTPGTRAARAPGRTDGGLRRFVNVYLNDEDVRFLGGLETPVTDGDTVTILPAVAGGRR